MPQPLSPNIFVSRPQHHFIRTFLASIFGALALNLILASVLVVWLNQTFTNTDVYMRTVAPLIMKPDIQNYIVDKTTENIVRNTETSQLAAAVLPAADIVGKSEQQLRSASSSVIRKNIAEIINTAQITRLWETTNRMAHADLIRQLNSDNDTIVLDISPLIGGMLEQLESSQLAGIKDQMQLPAEAGRLQLSGAAIKRAHVYYRDLQSAIVILIAATVVSTMLCVLFSVEHTRTFRRILIGTAFSTLFTAISLRSISLLKLKNLSPAEQKAAVAFSASLFHDLIIVLLAIGVGCVVLALMSKLYSKLHPSRVAKVSEQIVKYAP